MMRPVWSALLAAFLILCSAAPRAQAAAGPMAAAQGPAHGVSYSIWTVNGATVHLRFILPAAEARGLDPSAKARPDAAAASMAVDSQVAVTSAGGDCPQVVQSQWVGKIYTLALTPGLYRYEIIFTCPRPDGLVLHNGVLFGPGAPPNHINYARVQVGGGKPVLQTFTRERQTLAVGPAGAAPAGVISFAAQGLGRLLNQADRLCVIGALLLLARRWRDLIEIVAALAVGYLASLAIALNGALTTDPALAGAAVGLLAALLGVCALRLETIEPSGSRGWRIGVMASVGVIGAAVIAAAAMRGAPAGLAAAALLLFGLAQMWTVGVQPRIRWIVFAPAALFGLLDGLSLARDLSLLQLPSLGLLSAFAGYDLGALVAAGALAAIGMAVLWLAGKRLRSIQKVAIDLAAAALVGVGLFWFVTRLYSG